MVDRPRSITERKKFNSICIVGTAGSRPKGLTDVAGARMLSEIQKIIILVVRYQRLGIQGLPLLTLVAQ